MWLFIYATFFVDMATSIITLIYLSGIKLCDDTSNSLITIMFFSEFVIAVIALVYKKIVSADCSESWESTVPEFLTFIEIHCVTIWIFPCICLIFLFEKIVHWRHPIQNYLKNVTIMVCYSGNLFLCKTF